MKRVFVSLSIVTAILISAFLVLVYVNNKMHAMPAEKLQAESLERSIVWLVKHSDEIVNQNNMILWWMIGRSAELTSDKRLDHLYRRYLRRHAHVVNRSVWKRLFSPYAHVEVHEGQLLHLPDYNQYMIYGLTCDKSLSTLPIIERQMSLGFCPEYHPISPACVTHQLMALRFRQERSCGEPEKLASDISRLQQVIISQLTWDVRVVDVYLQRVLMLADSGAAERIKPVWLHNVMNAQLLDGSWGNFYPLLPLGGGRALGIGERFFRVQAPQGTFHATAQGILLMSLMTQSLHKQ